MRKLLLSGFVLFVFSCIGQTKVYLIHGLGADVRLFDSIQLPNGFNAVNLTYGVPREKDTMRKFAKRLISKIDTTRPFILLGVSLGGMLCVELNEFVKPQKTILISSVCNKYELPKKYRIQHYIPLYSFFPTFLLPISAQIAQRIVEPDRKKNKKTFNSMLGGKSGIYMKRTIGLIVNWERSKCVFPLIRIHGTNDHTLPIRHIHSTINYRINNGSHMMTLTKGKEISSILKKILVPI